MAVGMISDIWHGNWWFMSPCGHHALAILRWYGIMGIVASTRDS